MLTKRSITQLVFTTFIVVSLFFSSLGTTPVYAAGITVNTAVDETTTNGFCSLREAIHNANHDAATYPDCATGFGIDTITFAGNYTITLDGEQLPTIDSEIIINGNGAANTIIQAGASADTATSRVFDVGSNSYLTLDALTIRHGRAPIGGAIFVTSGGTMTVTRSILSGNRGENYGGAIVNSGGTVTLRNSTLSGNSALSSGGGIVNLVPPPTFTSNLLVVNSTLSGNRVDNFHGGGAIYNGQNMNTTVLNSTLSGNYAPMGGGIYNDGNLWLGNSTLSGNEAYDYGGGIYSDGIASILNSSIVFNILIEGTNLGAGGIDGNAVLYNSIVAGNMRAISAEYRDCHGTMSLFGMNLFWDTTNCLMYPITSDASWGYLNSLSLVGPLQNNGGPTLTHALLPGSNAIDTGAYTYCAGGPIYNLDQRGVTRPQGSQCDVGAFELEPNQAPADILLSVSTISENLPAGTTVGTLAAIDPNLGDTHTYSFCGGVDDAFFSLAGNTLNTAAVFDFELQNTFTICIRASDSGDMSFDKAFEILVLDATEGPAPETTFIDMKVRKPRGISNYMFLFTSSNSDSTFMCRLDQGTFSPCTNAITYIGLSTGLHTFQVYSIGPSGNPDLTPTEYHFTVDQ